LGGRSSNVSLYADEQATSFACGQPILVVAAIPGGRVRNRRIFQLELVAIELAMSGIHDREHTLSASKPKRFQLQAPMSSGEF
jgi:hypothetical protein